MRFPKKMFGIVVCLFCFLMDIHASERVLFYENFEEMDTRQGGNIFPEGVKRIRIGGRIFATEIEIEAPSSDGDTSSLARFVPDPSGLSLTVLHLDDRDTELGDGSFGAEGGISLLEAIQLDQGDHQGKAVVSWMGMAFQSNETGGTLFPETDSRIDPGPEGLNLAGFGGIQRNFDTGEPLPGQDFSNQLIFNLQGSAELSPIGVGYSPGIPTFFTLLFDFPTSTYSITINGILAMDNLPFFDIDGETGKTLRELEWISSARGLGTFAYDDMLQLDPDASYAPVPFRTPLIADDSEWIPVFMDNFDDDALGSLPAESSGDLVGTWIESQGRIEVMEDTSYRSAARLRIEPDSELILNHVPPADAQDLLRFSFTLEPSSGSTQSLQIGGILCARFPAGGSLQIDRDGDGMLEETNTAILPSLPHWISITWNLATDAVSYKMYRAADAQHPTTVLLENQGILRLAEPPASITLQAAGQPILLDNLLWVRNHTTPSGTEENRQRAILSETFDSAAPGASMMRSAPGEVVEDPSGWSAHRFQIPTRETLQLFTGATLRRSARLAWTAVPAQTSVECGVCSVQFNGQTIRRLVALLADGRLGVDRDGDGTWEPLAAAYSPMQRIDFTIVFDLERGAWELLSSATPASSITGWLAAPNSRAELNAATLSGNAGGFIQYDDLLVVADHHAGAYSPSVTPLPIYPDDSLLLFDEDFESDPPRSERTINEDDPRRSGSPIPAQSAGSA